MLRSIGVAALLTTAMVSPALAAGWGGLYVGAVGTVGIMSSDDSDHWCNVACNGPSQSGWGGGIGGTIGANWQDGPFVWGLEGDASWLNFQNKLITDPGPSRTWASIQSAKWNWDATFRGRAGVAEGNTLFYATGGLALVGVKYRSNYYIKSTGAWDGGFLPLSETKVGLAAGAGVEHQCDDGLTFKAEFLYIGLPGTNGGVYRSITFVPSSPDNTVQYRSNAIVVRLGVNYALD